MAFLRAARLIVLGLFPLTVLNCECGEKLTGIVDPRIEVMDEDGKVHVNADPWLTIAFGDVDEGASATHTLTIKNAGGGLLRIDELCLVSAETAEAAIGELPCLSGSGLPYSFPSLDGEYGPGEEVELPITFSPTVGGLASPFLRIRSNAVAEPAVAVQLTGRGTAGRLCADNPVLDFGEVTIGEAPTRQITLTNCGVRPLTIDSFALAANPDDVFTVQIAGADPAAPIGPLAENDAIVLDVTFAPQQVRRYRDSLAGNVQLSTAAPYVGQYTLLLVGDGRTPPACRLNVVPETLQFGTVAAGETATRQLVLQSVGECACTVESIGQPLPAEAGFFLPESPPAGVVLAGTRGCEDDPPEAAEAPASLVVDIGYAAPERASPEVENATLEIASSDPAAPVRTVNLEANGGGMPFCQLEVTPKGGGVFGQGAIGRYGVVSFGRVTVHFEKRQPITLTNIGNTECVIENVVWDVEENTLANEFGLEFEDGTPVPVGNVAPISLAPGQTTRFNAVFAPTHTIDSDNPFDIFSFGSYTASNGICGAFSPNTRCNGVKFVTTDSVTETATQDTGVSDGEFSIGFSATPVTPAIDVIPGSLDFGLVTLGCGSPEYRVTVYNTGSGDLVVGQPYAAPATNPAAFEVAAAAPSFPHTIAPGGSMAVLVRFRAHELGVVTGDLVIPTVEGGEEGPPVTVPLRGEGTTEREQTDIFQQFKDPKVDVLWVVDDSGSMAPLQTQLATNFDQFFVHSGVSAADFHIAVTTTLTVDGSCVANLDGTNSCEPHELCGHYTSCENNDRYLDLSSSNPEEQFACNVKVSNTSHVNPQRPKSDSAEGGLQAARAFLDPPHINGANAGFLRDDAKLHVIIVSDEPDQSAGSTALYVDFFKNLKGFRNDSLVAVSAIATVDICSYQDAQGQTASAGGDARYAEVVAETNGLFQSICAPDWTTMMSNLGLDSLGLRVEYFLSRAADAATLEVCVRAGGASDPTCTPVTQTSDGHSSGYFYDPSSNSIIFNPASVPVRGAQIEVHYETACY